ncbi:hypothetical protein [Cellulomonas sp.]|uniref:hypothetical protein n=1 Tax=Cellulomonas sp. TaxID=40001 RepID=UPI002811C0F8|nr:hypothetical protein [Cellulomonas sp.]
MSGTTGAAGTVRVPALRTRASARATATTAAVVLVVTAWTALTQPESRVGVAVGLVVLAVVALVVRRTSASLDLDAGVLVTRRMGLRREVPLVPGTHTALVPDGSGTLLLALRPRDAARESVQVLAVTDTLVASQPAEVLTALADSLEQHVGPATRGVVRALRGQAEHVAGGGTPQMSPLAEWLSRGAPGGAAARRAGGRGAGSGRDPDGDRGAEGDRPGRPG